VISYITQSDESNIDYIMSAGLFEFIVEVLQNNDPATAFFNLKVDTLINRILNNLLTHSSKPALLSANFIDGGSQWIMDRFAPRMAHNDVDARKESSLFMLNMLRIQSYSSEDWHRKVFLI
jgi:hypothetical protein